MTESTDADLVSGWLAGDASSATILIERYRTRLLARVGWWFRRDVHQAEDVAQAVWMRVTENLSTFDTARPFWPWLRGIADNSARQALRASYTTDYRRRLVPVSSPGDAEPLPVDDMSRAEDRVVLGSAVGALPAGQRAAFIAVHVKGVPRTEAADGLGVQENALRQSVFKAVGNLSRALEGVMVMAPLWALRRWWAQLRAKESLVPVLTAQVTAVTAGVLAATVALGPIQPSIGLEQPMQVMATDPDGEDVRARTADRTKAADRDDVPATSAQSAPDKRSETPQDTREPTASPVDDAEVAVPGTDVRVHRDPGTTPPDHEYGLHIPPPAPGTEGVKVGKQGWGEKTAALDEGACKPARTTPLTYCDSDR